MIPKTTQIDNDRAKCLKPVDADDPKPPVPTTPPSRLRPALQKAVEASWERNEEAYRYLGR